MTSFSVERREGNHEDANDNTMACMAGAGSFRRSDLSMWTCNLNSHYGDTTDSYDCFTVAHREFTGGYFHAADGDAHATASDACFFYGDI